MTGPDFSSALDEATECGGLEDTGLESDDVPLAGSNAVRVWIAMAVAPVALLIEGGGLLAEGRVLMGAACFAVVGIGLVVYRALRAHDRRTRLKPSLFFFW